MEEQLSSALPFAPNLWESRPGMPGGGGAGALLGGAGAVLSTSHSCVGQVGVLPTHLQPGERGLEGSLTPFPLELGEHDVGLTRATALSPGLRLFPVGATDAIVSPQNSCVLIPRDWCPYQEKEETAELSPHRGRTWREDSCLQARKRAVT